MMILATRAGAAGPEQPEPYVNRDFFPQAYRILTSDRLMFPHDAGDWPVRIDSRRQLFVDDYLIASMKGLRRQYHQPVKHPKNPIVVPDRPWEGPRLCVGTVMRDESTGRFRMWYRDGKAKQMYAESDDGVAWRKPELGLVTHEGSTKNNIILDSGYMIGMVREPAGDGGPERFTALMYHKPPEVTQPGFYVHRSSDGLHWTGDLKRPSVIPSENRELYSSVGPGDTSLFRHDPMLGCYVIDAKFNLYLPEARMKELGIPIEEGKSRIRSRTMMESEDLVHWTLPRMILFPDEHDERDSQIYGHISFVYETMWLGLLRVMHLERTGWKQVEIELSYSRDGRNWSRPDVRRPFLPLGDPESWEPDYTDSALHAPLLVNDELWFYYRGSRSNERDGTEDWKMAVGLAKLRRDGFVSLDAGPDPGLVTTRPLTFAGRSLFVNADVTDGGWIRAAVLSAGSEPLEGYRLDDTIPLTQNTTRGRIAWKTGKDLVPPGDDHVRLVLEVKNAKLYSFWIE